jgi:hypothetical protein
LEFAIYSDPLLRPVFWTGVGVVAMALAMVVIVFAFRVRLLLRQRREQRFIMNWRPLLMQSVDRLPEPLPPLPAADRAAFLRLWNYLQESLRGQATGNLNRLLVACRLDEYANRLIASRRIADQLLGAVTLGHLREPGADDALRPLAEGPHPLLSLVAARALLQIDPVQNLDWFMIQLARRTDWPLGKVAAVLSEPGADTITGPLIAAIEALAGNGGGGLVRLLNLLEIAHAERAAPVLRRILREAKDEQAIAASLRAVRDPRDLPLVRGLVAHSAWFVRVRAAQALGRLGAPEDRKLLTQMLSDAHWWVRYRAAQALVALPSVTTGELEEIRAILPDRFAADMLKQVMAEGRA